MYRWKELGQAISNRRAELAFSQFDLCARVKETDPTGKGVSGRTLSEIENGKARPTPKTLIRLDRGLGWPVGSCRRILMGELAPRTDPGPALEDRVAVLEDRWDRLAEGLSGAA